MDLNGTVEFAAPPEQALQSIQKKSQIALLFPEGVEIQARADQGFDFTFQREVGPFKIKQVGIVSVTPLSSGDSVELRGTSSHFLSGSVNMHFLLRFSGDAGTCRLDYTGNVKATGIADKVLNLFREKVAGRTRSAFVKFGRLQEMVWAAEKKAEALKARKAALGKTD